MNINISPSKSDMPAQKQSNNGNPGSSFVINKNFYAKHFAGAITEAEFRERLASMLKEDWKGLSPLYADVVAKSRAFVALLEKKDAKPGSVTISKAADELAVSLSKLQAALAKSQKSEEYRDDALCRLCTDSICFHVTNAITSINMSATSFPAYGLDSKYMEITRGSLGTLERLEKFMANPKAFNIQVENGRADFVWFVYGRQ